MVASTSARCVVNGIWCIYAFPTLWAVTRSTDAAVLSTKICCIRCVQPRWDQGTFDGRAKHFLTTTNPMNALASDEELEKAKELVTLYRYRRTLGPRGMRVAFSCDVCGGCGFTTVIH